MAKLALNIGARSVTLDTDQPAQSQQSFTTALSAEVTERVTAERERLETERVQPAEQRELASRTYIVDETIRLMRSSSDTSVSGQVDTDEKVTAERAFLLSLDFDRLTTIHKRYAGNATVAKPQTTTEPPEDPETLDPDEAAQKKLEAKYAPAKDTRVTMAIV